MTLVNRYPERYEEEECTCERMKKSNHYRMHLDMDDRRSMQDYYSIERYNYDSPSYPYSAWSGFEDFRRYSPKRRYLDFDDHMFYYNPDNLFECYEVYFFDTDVKKTFNRPLNIRSRSPQYRHVEYVTSSRGISASPDHHQRGRSSRKERPYHHRNSLPANGSCRKLCAGKNQGRITELPTHGVNSVSDRIQNKQMNKLREIKTMKSQTENSRRKNVVLPKELQRINDEKLGKGALNETPEKSSVQTGAKIVDSDADQDQNHKRVSFHERRMDTRDRCIEEVNFHGAKTGNQISEVHSAQVYSDVSGTPGAYDTQPKKDISSEPLERRLDSAESSFEAYEGDTHEIKNMKTIQETYQSSIYRPEENLATTASEIRHMSNEASSYQKVTDSESISFRSDMLNESVEHVMSEVFEPLSDNIGSNRRLSDPGSRKQPFESEYNDTKLSFSKPEIYEERMATIKSREREYFMRGTSEQSLPEKQLHMYEKNLDRSASSEVHISETDRSVMERSAIIEHDKRNDEESESYIVEDTLDQIDDTDSVNAWSNQPMTPTDLDNHPSTSSVDIFEFEKQGSRSATPQSAREYRDCTDSSLSGAHVNAENRDSGDIEEPSESLNEVSKILRNRMPPPIPPFSNARQKFSKKFQYTLKDGEELYKIFRRELILRVIYEFMRRRSNEKIMNFLSNKI